jgi:hypothetical protein
MSYRVERDDASGQFFDGAGQGQLYIRRCPVCAQAYPPDIYRCRDSDRLEWEAATGTGLLVSWAVDHGPPLDPLLASPDGATAVFGLVQLQEGPWLQVPIVDTDPTLLEEGMAMAVCFLRPGDGEAIPAFAPAR